MTSPPDSTTAVGTATELDRSDPLRWCRDEFLIPADLVYLDGNSLGPVARSVPEAIDKTLRVDWQQGLIRSWFDDADWWNAPDRTASRIAPLLGAYSDEVTVGDSVSVQIFNLLIAASRLRPMQRKLIVDSTIFPSDRYVAESVGRLVESTIEVVPMDHLTEVLEADAGSIGTVLASAVDYRTGQLWDVDGICDAAIRNGSIVVWDLCHAVGAVPIDVHDTCIEMAVGCTYKFLSGGPGAPAFAFIARHLLGDLDLPLTGWHGTRRPFDFSDVYEPAPSAGRARIGTPPILSLAALEAALEIFECVSIADIRDKNIRLGQYLIDELDTADIDDIALMTPRRAHQRGSQVSLAHPAAAEVTEWLAQRGILCDFRPPDTIRFGLNSLYNSFSDLETLIARLSEFGGR